jgi:hypothetical protein
MKIKKMKGWQSAWRAKHRIRQGHALGRVEVTNGARKGKEK